ncbi:MAG: MBOAT family protein [Duncaniella sp.]|nr:MBOAT family protein [Duncaniella sp.]
MTFNSFEFLLFLPTVFLIFWALKGRTARNLFIILSSYLFYGWWDCRFLLLIAFTTACSYASGLMLAHTEVRWKRLAVVWGNVVINLSVLGIFKYYNFFVGALQTMLAPMGFSLDTVTLTLILPVGISFYTFQALSYTIDVYRGKISATRDAIAFFAFISFFPQLVAGPIERATNLLPQFLSSRRFDYAGAVAGMRLILWGLFKKAVVADNCAGTVDYIFSHWETAGALSLWYGALCFSIQIYCDFSGYSDMAIGTARLFGYELMRNFRLPYFSRDIAEFWRRWHISLTTWFRDYVYIPLGGSRTGKGKVARNTMIVFLTSGLWHGANFTYVAWGLYHSMLFLPMILTGRNRRHTGEPGRLKGIPAMRESAMMGLTFLLVMIGWVIFRADNISHAFHYIGGMFTEFGDMHIIGSKAPLIWIALLGVIEWTCRFRVCPLDFEGRGVFRFRTMRWGVYFLMFMTVILFGGASKTFIYFQF